MSIRGHSGRRQSAYLRIIYLKQQLMHSFKSLMKSFCATESCIDVQTNGNCLNKQPFLFCSCNVESRVHPTTALLSDPSTSTRRFLSLSSGAGIPHSLSWRSTRHSHCYDGTGVRLFMLHRSTMQKTLLGKEESRAGNSLQVSQKANEMQSFDISSTTFHQLEGLWPQFPAVHCLPHIVCCDLKIFLY